MANNSEILTFNINDNPVSQLNHPGDSTSIATSDKVKGDGYYNRADGFHTVQYNITDFIGTIVTQATLALNPIEEDWFNVGSTNHYGVISDATSMTGSKIYNFTGNYVWIRINITDWTAGTIRSIILNH